jgi:histidinol-phosphatase
MADEAADIALEVYGREFEVRRKADTTPVTEADVRIEARLRQLIGERFPEDAVLGEEAGLQGPSDAARVWVIDPIDGTKNFAARIQVWATLIALMVDGQPVLGVASAPALGERYVAARGAGAILDGAPIHVSDVGDLGDAMLCTGGVRGFAGTPWEDRFVELSGDVYRTRGFGDFWGHVLVARGSAEAMVEVALRTWDWAAIAVIVGEAGGRVTQIDGSPPADGASILTTNGVLHDRLIRRFASGP